MCFSLSAEILKLGLPMAMFPATREDLPATDKNGDTARRSSDPKFLWLFLQPVNHGLLCSHIPPGLLSLSALGFCPCNQKNLDKPHVLEPETFPQPPYSQEAVFQDSL